MNIIKRLADRFLTGLQVVTAIVVIIAIVGFVVRSMRVGAFGISELIVILIILAILILLIGFLIRSLIRKPRSGGGNQIEDTQRPPVTGAHCGKCGAAVTSEDKFCTSCGAER